MAILNYWGFWENPYLTFIFIIFFRSGPFLKSLWNWLQHRSCLMFFGPKACGILVPRQGWNPLLSGWQAKPQPLDHPGIPRMMILIFSQLIRHPLTKFFRLSNLLRVLNNPRMVATEFFGSFSCSCKRISFGDCSQLVVVSFWWPATVLLVFKALISFVKLREPRLHCTFVNIPRPSELLML